MVIVFNFDGKAELDPRFGEGVGVGEGGLKTPNKLQVLRVQSFTSPLPLIRLFDVARHYNAWKLSTCSFPVRIEILRLMNKMSAKILNFVIGWNKPIKFWKSNQMSQ